MDQCIYCKGTIFAEDTVCPHCLRESPAETERKRRSRSAETSAILLVLYAVVALFIGGMVIARSTDHGALHQIDVDDCITDRNKSHWIGSSGMTLERFCGATAALPHHKREHPAKY